MSTPMHTKEEILEKLEKASTELAERYGISYIALFGSYARGEQSEDSDVDILVEIAP
ncbi:MAG: nucleotidyltransferase family protein, partial [Thermoleophilia bacterium]